MMEAISQHAGKVYPLNRSNVDTDQIIPKQFLKRIERTGFGEFVFYNWRFNEDGSSRDDFDMDDKKFEDASILIAGDNFGCGSSREHALGHYRIMAIRSLLHQVLQIFFIQMPLKTA